MKLDYGKGEVDVTINAWTMAVYEQAFHSDLIGDVLGKVMLQDDDEAIVNYGATNWTSCLKGLWAALRSTDPTFPSFDAWARGVGDIDMNEVSRVVTEEVLRNLFRTRAGDSE